MHRDRETDSARIRELERQRLWALVHADMAVAESLHAPDFQLVNPHGGVLSRDDYLGAIGSGQIAYRRFEPISSIEVMVGDDVAVLRYRSQIHVEAQGGSEIVQCWHTDCYRRVAGDDWQAVWSQATITEPGPAPDS